MHTTDHQRSVKNQHTLSYGSMANSTISPVDVTIIYTRLQHPYNTQYKHVYKYDCIALHLSGYIPPANTVYSGASSLCSDDSPHKLQFPQDSSRCHYSTNNDSAGASVFEGFMVFRIHCTEAVLISIKIF